jgi:F-type H+-transporting ATPase subunit a
MTPMEEAQDHAQYWHLIGDFFGWEVAVPLLDLRPIGIPFTLTRFMVVELVAAIIVAWSFIWLGQRIKNGDIARGKRANMLEAMVLFVRNEVVRPVMGGKSGDFILPYIWTAFFFILTCNLLGMIPLVGAPMASLWITMSLAICSLILIHAVPIAKLGLLNYLKTMWIPIDIPIAGPLISLMLFVIEFLSTFIKGLVLGIRLFANIFVGHVVLATIISFAGAAQILMFTSHWPLDMVVTIGSVVGAILLSMLELFVAFLQAYVFAILSAMFIGLPLVHHAEHEKEHAHHDEHAHDQPTAAHPAH